MSATQACSCIHDWHGVETLPGRGVIFVLLPLSQAALCLWYMQTLLWHPQGQGPMGYRGDYPTRGSDLVNHQGRLVLAKAHQQRGKGAASQSHRLSTLPLQLQNHGVPL